MARQTAHTTTRDTPSITIGYGPAALPTRVRWPRVLVAEDDEDLRLLLCNELHREGLNVVGCASAREAVQQREWINAIAGNPWSLDVIVTDLRLGEFDGLALLQRVAEADVDLPVVLISAFADSKARTRAAELGAAAFLDKPVAMEMLRGLVHRLARERHRRVQDGAHAPRARSWRRLEG